MRLQAWVWALGVGLAMAAAALAGGARAQPVLPPELVTIYAAEREAALRGDADGLHAFTLREATFADPSRVQTESENLSSDREMLSRYKILALDATPIGFEQAGPEEAVVTLDSTLQMGASPRTGAERRAVARVGTEWLSMQMTFTIVDRWRLTDAGWRRLAQTATSTSVTIDPALKEALEAAPRAQ